MSHFKPSSSDDGRSDLPVITITKESAIHYGIIFVLVLGIMLTTYLLITKCKRYWVYRIEEWRMAGHKKDDDD